MPENDIPLFITNQNFADLPCGTNCGEICEIRPKMLSLINGLKQLENRDLIAFVCASLESYAELCRADNNFLQQYGPETFLPAIFDLGVTAFFVERVGEVNWLVCSEDGQAPYAYYCFLGTCPRCSLKPQPPVHIPSVCKHKPESSLIGSFSQDVMHAILSTVLSYGGCTIKVGKSSDSNGDIDFVINNREKVLLLEIKSSPLVVYPLAVPLTGDHHLNHSALNIDLIDQDISLFVPHKHCYIPLGKKLDDAGWAFRALASSIREPSLLRVLLEAWKELNQTYQRRERYNSRHPAESKRWLNFGCGKIGEYSVDDSKNRPGLDRTDDIKKGIYQSAKFTLSYKAKCSSQRLMAVLSSNFWPWHHADHYLFDLLPALITDKINVTIEEVEGRCRVSASPEKVFYLLDTLLCLDRSHYNNEYIEQNFNPHKSIREFLQRTPDQ